MKPLYAFVASALVWPLASLSGCSGECVQPPCALPIAISLTVTSSASGNPIYDAAIQTAGSPVSQACPGSCIVGGGAGTYDLTVSAPGFQSVERSVIVSGTGPVRCGCGGVTTEHLAVALAPTT